MTPRPILILLLALVFSTSAVAQQDDEDVQSWNDLQVTVPLNKRVDLTLFGTLRLASNLTQASEARIGAGLGFKVTDAISIAPSYLAITSRNTAGSFKDEHRFAVRGTYKFPTKSFGLSHRSTYEYRVRTAGNSWRYRAGIVFEKKLPTKFLPKSKLFIIEEVFYISTTKRFSRNRFSIGVNREINKKLSLDIYYLRQNDGYSRPGDLNVIGTTWKVHF